MGHAREKEASRCVLMQHNQFEVSWRLRCRPVGWLIHGSKNLATACNYQLRLILTQKVTSVGLWIQCSNHLSKESVKTCQNCSESSSDSSGLLENRMNMNQQTCPQVWNHKSGPERICRSNGEAPLLPHGWSHSLPWGTRNDITKWSETSCPHGFQKLNPSTPATLKNLEKNMFMRFRHIFPFWVLGKFVLFM